MTVLIPVEALFVLLFPSKKGKVLHEEGDVMKKSILNGKRILAVGTLLSSEGKVGRGCPLSGRYVDS